MTITMNYASALATPSAAAQPLRPRWRAVNRTEALGEYRQMLVLLPGSFPAN